MMVLCLRIGTTLIFSEFMYNVEMSVSITRAKCGVEVPIEIAIKHCILCHTSEQPKTHPWREYSCASRKQTQRFRGVEPCSSGGVLFSCERGRQWRLQQAVHKGQCDARHMLGHGTAMTRRCDNHCSTRPVINTPTAVQCP